jgi:hypothetical protein
MRLRMDLGVTELLIGIGTSECTKLPDPLPRWP